MHLNEEMDYQETVLILGVLLFATIHRTAEGCRGPGPIQSYRHPRKTLVPLVLKQHIPNISEKTIGASGPAEGKISRSDKRFKDLTTNMNPAIVFRDEERTNADRRMTKRCNDKLNTLASMVQARWPKVKLRVVEGWDEDMRHETGSLHYEGRAVDITTSDTDKTKYGMLARLAVEAGFDWVFYESKYHIHASVIADDEQSLAGSGCFTESSTVRMEDGSSRTMGQLRVGDRIQVVNRETGEQKLSDVILLMHKDDEAVANFLRITAQEGTQIRRQITLTANHLIYKHGLNKSGRWQPVAVFAEDLKQGDYVYINDHNSSNITISKVTFIESVQSKGVYAPLTAEGSIVVDGIAASSYALYSYESVSHALFYPLRLLWRWGLRWDDTRNVLSGLNSVHWYPKYIYDVASILLPKGSLNT